MCGHVDLIGGMLACASTHLFGPATNAANLLESKTANYPRVIVQEDLLLAARHAPAAHHEAHDEVEYMKSLLRRDFDGLLYIDYIGGDSVVSTLGGDNDLYPKYVTTISQLLSKYTNSLDLTIRAKYGWIARHYMKANSEIERLPDGHPFRLENPGYLEQISKLPSFPVPGLVVE